MTFIKAHLLIILTVLSEEISLLFDGAGLTIALDQWPRVLAGAPRRLALAALQLVEVDILEETMLHDLLECGPIVNISDKYTLQ